MFNLPEELSVPLGKLTGATHRDDVAVMGPDLHHHAGLVPLPRVVTVLVLDKDMITDLERREATGALGQPLLHVELPPTVGLSSPVCSKPPVLSGNEFAWLERESVTNNTAIDDLSRAESGDGTRSVAVY